MEQIISHKLSYISEKAQGKENQSLWGTEWQSEFKFRGQLNEESNPSHVRSLDTKALKDKAKTKP